MIGLGQRLKDLRKAKNLTIRELAKIIDVNKSAISFWENDTNEPKATYINRLAIYFDVTSDFILGLEDESGRDISNKTNIVNIKNNSNCININGDNNFL